MQDLVAKVPRSLTYSGQPLPFNAPGTGHRSRYLPQSEAPEPFAHACRGGVAEGCYINVMSTIVLQREVAVASGCEDDFREPPLKAGLLVPEFMANVNAVSPG